MAKIGEIKAKIRLKTNDCSVTINRIRYKFDLFNIMRTHVPINAT